MRQFVYALSLVFVGAVGAETLTIKDLPLGGDLRAEGARLGLWCGTMPGAQTKMEACTVMPSSNPTEQAKTIAGVPTKSVFLFGYSNVLGAVMFTFDQAHFPSVRRAFTEKYPAMECRDSVVQNRLGASFEQTSCALEVEDVRLTLDRRGTDLGSGRVQVTTRAHAAAAGADAKRQAQEGKKDI